MFKTLVQPPRSGWRLHPLAAAVLVACGVCASGPAAAAAAEGAPPAGAPASAPGAAAPLPAAAPASVAAGAMPAAPAVDASAPTPPAPTPQAEDAPTQRVEVRGRRSAGPGSTRSLSGRDAAQVPGVGSDPLRALQVLPGVVTANDASAEPAVRGSRPDDNAYLVDFMPVGYLFHVGGLVSVLPGDLVQRFDLHSAAFGPEFPDVTGAVVDVALRDPRSDGFHGKLDVSFLSGGVVLEGPLAPGHSVLVAARRSWLDWVIGQQTDEHSGVITQMPRYRDYQVKYLWEPDERQRLSLHLNGAADHMSYSVPPGTVLAQQQPAFTGDGHDSMYYDTQALLWELDAGAGLRNRLALGRIGTHLDSHTGSVVDLGASAQTWFVREQAHWRLQPGHELWLGGTLNRTQVKLALDYRNPNCTEFEPDCDYSGTDPLLLNTRLRLNNQALFARERWQFHPDWALSTGLRWSRDAYLNEQHLEPRLGLEWAWSPTLTLDAAWGRHNQSPSFDQVLPELGNPALERLRGRHAMLGLSQKLPGAWNWRVEVYDKQLGELVTSDAQTHYANAGQGHAWGAELLLRKEAGSGAGWQDRLTGWASVSWARAVRENTQTGERFSFAYDQPLVINLVARWRHDEQVSWGARWSLHSGGLFTPIVGTTTDATGRVRPVYGALNSERLPTYHRLDLRADYRLTPRLTGYAELLNAYNHKNIGGWAYNVDYTQRTAETQLSQTASLGLEWKF